jgi:hydrogenase maturation protease
VILIIGYGNPLRGDDAIGQKIAHMMEERLQGIQVITAYQLTPELAEVISQAQFVIFIDAGVGKTPGTLSQEVVKIGTDAGAFTHNVTPETLLSAAETLYGATTAGLLISIAGASLDYGVELSPQIDRILPELADRVEEIIKIFRQY